MKIVTVLGARPQFIKAAAVSAALARSGQVDEVLVHTGQHYDDNMSEVFFSELGIPRPKHNLAVGSASHGVMTGKMLIGIEPVLLEEKPDWLLVYGDTNSTLAGALAAAKLHVPVCHIEAGLRSFEKRMPEEQNRIVTDHLASLLMCPTRAAMTNLAREGIVQGAHHVGDVMFDAARVFGERAESASSVLQQHALSSRGFHLCTVHRAENTDSLERLDAILQALVQLATASCPVILPLHPRTRGHIERSGRAALLASNPAVKCIEPVGFLDMLMLEKHARVILTDSGGVQKEAYFQGVPCVTLRDETEWVETVAAGWNRLVGADTQRILDAITASGPRHVIDDYGQGYASERIAELLLGAMPAPLAREDGPV